MVGRLHQMIDDAQKRFQQGRQFVMHDLWDLDLSNVSGRRRQVYSLLRMIFLVARGFAKDKLSLQAASLTYYTLMSMVPVLVVVFSVARGFGAHERLRDFISQNVLPNVSLTSPDEQAEPFESRAGAGIGTRAGIGMGAGGADTASSSTNGDEVVSPAQFLDRLFSLVDRVDPVALGSIGVAAFLWTAIRMMGRIETSFNAIWGVREDRPLLQRFAYYSGVIIIAPVMLLLVSGINGVLAGEDLQTRMQALLGGGYVLYWLLLQIFGILGISLTFSFAFLQVPNTRVRLTSALMGGVCAGIMWMVWQWACFNAQLWVSGINKIYGAFATIPITLIWLQVNWLIILFGCEICFAWQNYRTYTAEAEAIRSSFQTRRVLAFYLIHQICQAFRERAGGWNLHSFRHDHNVPIRLLRSVLWDLQDAGIIAKIGEDEIFLPARDISVLTPRDVERALTGTCDRRVSHLLKPAEPLTTTFVQQQLGDYLDKMDDASLADLLKRSQAGEDAAMPD